MLLRTSNDEDPVAVSLMPTQDRQPSSAKQTGATYQLGRKTRGYAPIILFALPQQGQLDQLPHGSPPREQEQQRQPWRTTQKQPLAPPGAQIAFANQQAESIAMNQHTVEIEQHDARRKRL
ncbi:hypothetical protein RF55_24243 [Lasius niger]|uniref:Uncharacterized protein n=1 Tax=Lasius niger TaxID=67767 RepID=A0A0J7JVF6_LASNI|nr:hypothetical protein RF55_24243 [Lasius niger]